MIAPDEAELHAEASRTIARMQEKISAKEGPGRAAHRHQITGATATLRIVGNLPAHAEQGLFVKPDNYPALVRLSNGAVSKQLSARPDIRGFAFRVSGVHGQSALSTGTSLRHTDTQVFSLINQPTFGFRTSEDFVGIMAASADGDVALTRHVASLGPRRALEIGAMLAKMGARPFTGFATEEFFSAAPVRWGDYAAKLRLVPPSGPLSRVANAVPTTVLGRWYEDLHGRLLKGPITYQLQAQFFTDEKRTPIEDASREWDSPFITVAELTLRQQDIASEEGREISAQAEASIFDPWVALAAHRPLGEIMRARRAVYVVSERARGAL